MDARETWQRMAVKFGPGWALAALLVYFLLVSVSQAQTDIKSALVAHQSDMQLDARQTALLLRAICINQAKADAERTNCLEAAREMGRYSR